MEQHQGIFGCKIFGIRISSLGQLENFLKYSKEVNNPRQMALDEPIPNTMTMEEPKAKNKYKMKNEKEDTIVEELMVIAQTMVGDKFWDE
jgi:hypothetical protein